MVSSRPALRSSTAATSAAVGVAASVKSRVGKAMVVVAVAAGLAGCRPTQPQALPSECGKTFDFDATGIDLLGDDIALRTAATSAAKQGGASITLGELTTTAGWTPDGWDRMVVVREYMRASQLNAAAQVFDICWQHLPTSSGDSWDEDRAQHEAFYLFFRGDTPVQSMWWVPWNAPFDLDYRGKHAVVYPNTVLTAIKFGPYESWKLSAER